MDGRITEGQEVLGKATHDVGEVDYKLHRATERHSSEAEQDDESSEFENEHRSENLTSSRGKVIRLTRKRTERLQACTAAKSALKRNKRALEEVVQEHNSSKKKEDHLLNTIAAHSEQMEVMLQGLSEGST